MKSEQDAINALTKVHFLERTEELAKKYRRITNGKKIPKLRKEKVFEIINKYGYITRYCFDSFELRTDDSNGFSYKIAFQFYYNWVQFFFRFQEGDEIIFNGAWWKIKRRLANDEDYHTGSPAYTSYEDFEEILTEAIKIYEDSVKALYENE